MGRFIKRSRIAFQNYAQDKLSAYNKLLKDLKAGSDYSYGKEGSLYKVELAPKENEYLLWDKPLSEQPKGVKEKLAKVPLERVGLEVEASPYDFGTAYFLKKIDGGRIGRVDSSTKTLADIKNLSVGNWMDAVGKTPQTSAALKEAGIRGIKYLDGSSRSKGEGDYNYVIFDEADVQITDKLFMPAGENPLNRNPIKDNQGPVMDFNKNWNTKFSNLDKFIEEAELVGTRWAPKGDDSFYPLGYKTDKNFEGSYSDAIKKKEVNMTQLRKVKSSTKFTKRI